MGRRSFEETSAGGEKEWCLKKKIGKTGKKTTKKRKTGKYSTTSEPFLKEGGEQVSGKGKKKNNQS